MSKLNPTSSASTVNLNPADYDQILNNNIFYRQDLQLAPGEYTLDLIVKDKQLPPNPEFADVFVTGKQLIRPSAARQFKNTDNLIMFLAVYNAANSPETGKPLVRVRVRLMKDGQPATKPFDYVLSAPENQPVPHLTFAEYIKLAGLAPGKYTAAIEIKDMVTRKLVKQDAAFTIVP